MDGLFWRMEDLAGWLTALIVLGLILEYKGWGEKRLRHGGLVSHPLGGDELARAQALARDRFATAEWTALLP